MRLEPVKTLVCMCILAMGIVSASPATAVIDPADLDEFEVRKNNGEFSGGGNVFFPRCDFTPLGCANECDPCRECVLDAYVNEQSGNCNASCSSCLECTNAAWSYSVADTGCFCDPGFCPDCGLDQESGQNGTPCAGTEASIYFPGDGDECAGDPCLNGGACIDGRASYTCDCTAGFTGTNCEEVDDCAGTPCQNGGVCTDGVNSFTCSCATGFSGDTCGTNIDDCASTPCQNGGVCTDGVDSFTCSCATGFSGDTCEVAANDFQCWQAKDLKAPKFVAREDVPSSDEFAAAPVDVTKPSMVCAPASIGGSPVGDASAFLCCYKVSGPKPTTAPKVEIEDGFGSLQLQLNKPAMVCRPCAKTDLP